MCLWCAGENTKSQYWDKDEVVTLSYIASGNTPDPPICWSIPLNVCFFLSARENRITTTINLTMLLLLLQAFYSLTGVRAGLWVLMGMILLKRRENMSTTRTTQLYIHRESIPLSCSESQLLLHCQRWAQTWGANIQLMYEYIFNPGGKEQIRIVQTNIHLQMYSLDLSLSQIKCQTHLLISSFKQLVSTSCQHLVTWLG